MKLFSRLAHDENGGPAAEFALVLPVALLFLAGIIDVGRYMWTYNEAEKATQMGVRYAVTTDAVPSGLAGYSFAQSCGVTQGNQISSAQFPGMTCQGGGTVAAPTVNCTFPVASSCTTNAIPNTSNVSAFGNIVNRMRQFKPDIAPAQVQIRYSNSGLGYAGDPTGMDVAPLVTITVTGLQFKPLTTQIFGTAFTIGPFSYSLTMEDGEDTYSN